MPRTARRAPGGVLFHVLNRGNARTQIYDDDEDYNAFERVLTDTLAHVPMRILVYCLMPNHWHFVLWPREEGHLGEFMRRVTTTHVRRWHLHRQSVGAGHLYQGTYKSFPIQKDEHLLTVCQYVEPGTRCLSLCNEWAVRAKLVEKAEEWPWSSLWQRLRPAEGKGKPSLSEWPFAQRADWVEPHGFTAVTPMRASAEPAEAARLRQGFRLRRSFRLRSSSGGQAGGQVGGHPLRTPPRLEPAPPEQLPPPPRLRRTRRRTCQSHATAGRLRRPGSRGSLRRRVEWGIVLKPQQSWRRCVAQSRGAAHMERQAGSGGLRPRWG